ncbi:MAG: AraC family transcriptional regulator [Verrucomicrobia bacterium Tous-C9LFEB]|nr:MAG: AraC family transcriptional regulator [Verrucomicrobia bacterium Tous-C9LFEB]
MNEGQLLSPEQWQECHVQLLRLRWGPPTEEGRKLECSPNDLTAWRLERGRVSVKTSKEEFIAHAGDWLFLGIGYRRQEFSIDAQLTSLAFRIYWPDSLRPVLDLRPGLKLRPAVLLDQRVESLRQETGNPSIYEWHFRGARCDIDSVLHMDGWFRTWLADAIRLWRQHIPDLKSDRAIDPRVEAARRWVMMQSEVEQLTEFQGAAEAAGLSVGHLNRLFIDHYHQTLHGFQEQRRIQYARRRLLEAHSRIKVVAYELGFHDLSKFSSWFRRLEQLSPRKYRSKFADKALPVKNGASFKRYKHIDS